MVEGPPLAEPAVARIAQRPTGLLSRAESGSQPAAAGDSATAESTTDSSGSAVPGAGATVSTPAIPDGAGAIARAQQLRADLVHAQTMLQTAADGAAAVNIIRAAMAALAQSALDPNLTDTQRTELDAAFRALQQAFGVIVETTVFEGVQILRGGPDPGGAYAASVPVPGKSSPVLEILIPPAALILDTESHDIATLRTADAAGAALRRLETGGRVLPSLEQAIAVQRATLQQVYATELDPARRLADEVGSERSSGRTDQMFHLVSTMKQDGQPMPFDLSAERLRGILQQSTDHPAPSRPIRQNEASVIHPIARPRGRTDLSPNTAAPVLRGEPTAENVVQPSARDESREKADPGLRFTSPTEQDPAFTTVLPGSPKAGFAAADVEPIAVAGQAAPDLEAAVRLLHRAIEQHVAVQRSYPGMGTGVSSGTTTTAQPHGLAVPRPTTAAIPISARDRMPVDITAEQLAAAALDPGQAKHLATAELRLADLSRIGELDTLRRAPGPVPQHREAEPRMEAQFAVVKPAYDEPADRLDEFGAALAAEPAGFMAELLRADNILHVADAAVEQIGLHLDYLGVLAGEAATDLGRDRRDLDAIFQAVKSDVIDRLAQETEAQGEKILAGGDSGGAYVIRLPLSAEPGAEHEIAIPSMGIRDLSPGLSQAHILTAEAAAASLDHIERAREGAAQARDMIGEERALLRRLIAMETARLASHAPLVRSALGL